MLITRNILAMNPSLSLARTLALLGAVAVLGGCANMKLTHVPPGESMNVALAKKAELVALPAPAPGATVSPVEPELPAHGVNERVTEAYSRGEFFLGAGRDDEAIAAFQEAVRIDPAFTEAWQHLAMLYEKKGESKKAIDAFRRAKKVAQH